MGASQSLDAFFGSPNLQSDSEQADVYQYLRRVEKTLWRTGPWWEHDGAAVEIEVKASDARARRPSKRSTAVRDPLKKMVQHCQLLEVLLLLYANCWGFGECVDPTRSPCGHPCHAGRDVGLAPSRARGLRGSDRKKCGACSALEDSSERWDNCWEVTYFVLVLF